MKPKRDIEHQAKTKSTTESTTNEYDNSLDITKKEKEMEKN